MSYLYLIIYLLIAAAVQGLAGNFPLTFFAFPLNVVVAVIWLLFIWRLYHEKLDSGFVRYMVSPHTSVISIILFIAGALVIGLFPQLLPIETAEKSGMAARLGCYDFMTSWIFIAIFFFMLSNLALVIINVVYTRKKTQWRFLLNHCGLWLALFAGFFGSADTQILRIPVYIGEPTSKAYNMDGASQHLDYKIELRSFDIEYYPNGSPSHYEAQVRIGDDDAVLQVNHPYSYRWGEDVYLTGYDVAKGKDSSCCILQVVRQPWKYIVVIGICMMLCGAVLLFINGSKRV